MSTTCLINFRCFRSSSSPPHAARFIQITIEGVPLLQRISPPSPAAEFNVGCTGKIVSGDLVVKDWEDPPLHLVCAKRVWRKTVEDILEEKKEYKDLGTTADKEASQPSASVPSHLEDFESARV